MKIKNSLLICYILISTAVYSQKYNDYTYTRKLNKVENKWHSLKLPNDVFGSINTDFSDLRIIGVKADNDTIEAPYLLKVYSDKLNLESIKFSLINQVKNGNGYYYTFELSAPKYINYIDLEFANQNFDWRVKLEGSQDQLEWFTVVDNVRILSINNSFTSYKYTALKFDDIKFKFFRLFIPSSHNPKFIKASINKKVINKGRYIIPKIVAENRAENIELKQTEINIELSQALPISQISINVLDEIDFYRPIIFQYATDSIKNNTGWHRVYSTIYHSTLSSIGSGQFKFSNTIMKHIKIIIKNGDNEPLEYDFIKARGDVHQLVGRFNEKATYYLLYGNTNAYVPAYDISRFDTKIPSNLKQVGIGNEIINKKDKNEEVKTPFITDSKWLWAIMLIAIFILGWFSLNMLKDK